MKSVDFKGSIASANSRPVTPSERMARMRLNGWNNGISLPSQFARVIRIETDSRKKGLLKCSGSFG